MLCSERKRLQEKVVTLSLERELVGRDSNRVIFGNVMLCERRSAAAAASKN